MSSRPPNDRGPGGSQHDSQSPYKRSRPQSPQGSALQRTGAHPYFQDPRLMVAAAVAAGGYRSIYSDPFQTQPTVDQHARDVRDYTRDRLPVVAQASSRDADLLQLHKRRPTLLDYHPQHGQGAAVSTSGLDRARYRPEPIGPYGQHFPRQDMGNLQGAPSRPSMAPDPDPGPQTPKRPRLAMDRPDLAQPLMIDVSQAETKRVPAYNPQVEAISPTLPPEETLKVQKIKDDLLQNISKIDREIAMVEQQIQLKMKKKQQQEEAANKQKEEVEQEDMPETSTVDVNHQSIAQIIYAENRRKAQESHHLFNKMGPKVDLPLYNQPSDAPIYHENKRKFALFKPRLIQYFKKRHQARKIRERYLTQRYDQLMQVWVKKVEKWENNPKRKAKEAKLREYYEKIFPELKKAKEDKDRLSRTGTRAGMAVYARSEAELEQIMDGLHEQEEEDRKMRSLAVIPPMMLDARQRGLKFVNKNGLIKDCMEEYKERKYVNVWTAQEKQIFKEKYLQHPKNFGLIASFLEKKSTMDCVEYYYRSKKSENYKQMLRKQTVKKKRQQQKNQAQPVIKEEVMEVLPAELPAREAAGTSAADETMPISSSASGGPPVRPDTGSMTIPAGSEMAGGVTVKEEEDKDMMDESSDENETKGVEGDGGVHPCAICKTQLEHYGLSRALTVKNCEMYGIIQSDLTPDVRVCNNCWCKSVRRRFTQCPVPTCKTPKRKVKRLRPMPTKWFEMAPGMKESIMKELMLTEDINKCCSACFNRIARRLGSVPSQPETTVTDSTSSQLPIPMQQEKPPEPQPESSNIEMQDAAYRWTEDEMKLMKKGLCEHGRDFAGIAAMIGSKTEAQCRNFYNTNRRKHNLDALITEPKDKEEDRRTVSICESVASTVTAPSDGEQNLSETEDPRDSDDSGTASAPSPRPLHLDDRDSVKDQKADLSCQGAGDAGSEVTEGLAAQKALSMSQGSLRSIPDNDSTATLSADEAPMGEKQQQQYPGSLQPGQLPLPDTSTRQLAQVGAIGLSLQPGRPASSPAQSPGNSNHSYPSRPGSRMSPASSGAPVHSRPNSRPSSHEVPIIREANPNQGPGPAAIDFSNMKYSQYQQGREMGNQPRRPSSVMSEPGVTTHRAISSHVPGGTQAHMLLGIDPSRGTASPQDKKSLKTATNVRDLIHSAIERNLSQDNVERTQQAPDRPRSTDTGYRPSSQPMAQMTPHDLRATDLRKDPRATNYPDQRGSPYQMMARSLERDPRDMHGDHRDMRGTPGGGIDLSIRQQESMDKSTHGYKGDPRDFDIHHMRRQGDDPQQRKGGSMETPPPAHSHGHRRSPFPIQEAIPLKARQDAVDKSPNLYQERQTLSPSVRGLPPASSPYSPHSSSKDRIPPPPPLINNSSSPRLPKSPPSSHLPPQGSITHGTPVGHGMTTTAPSSGRQPQPAMARGSITQGTPIRETAMGRGVPPHHEQAGPRQPGQYDIRMMEQHQIRGMHPQQMYDPRALEQLRMHHPGYQQPPYQYPQPPSNQQGEYSTKQTIMSDYVTARQMRHQSSPTEKDPRADPRSDPRPDPRADPRGDPRDPRDQSISPRTGDHGQGPPQGQKGYQMDPRMGYPVQGPMMLIPPGQGQQPSSSRVSPRPSSSIPSPRDDKSGNSQWMMAQRGPPGANMAAPPSHPHMDPSMQQYPPGPGGRPSITQGTGRQTVITDSRADDRYRAVPDSSGSHHSPRMSQQEYLQRATPPTEHRRSPAVHPDYRQQQQQYERERERQEKEMRELALREARSKYEQGIQRFNEDQMRQKQQQEADDRREILNKMLEDPKKRSPKVSQATDLLKVFASDQQQPRGKQQESQGKGGRSMTAACLIDAIIVHQINQSTEDGNEASGKPKQDQKPPVSQSNQQQQQQQQQQHYKQHQQHMGQGQMYQQGQGHPGQGHPQMQGHSQGYAGQGYPPGHPSQGQVSQDQGYPPQGQPQLAGQGYPGQPYPGQRGQAESKSPPAQMAGKKRWMQSPINPASSTSYSPGSSSKSDPDSKPPSRPGSRGSGGTPSGLQQPQDSSLRQAVLGNMDSKQMTLGDHINTIILMDYQKKPDSASSGPTPKSFLSQINGSTQLPTTSVGGGVVSQAGSVSSSTTVSENSPVWSQASVTSGQSDPKLQTAFPGHKKFKWRQTNDQASSSGVYDPSVGVSQSLAPPDDRGNSRQAPPTHQEGEWRHMRPDQSHSPNVSATGPPASPPGQADSSSSSLGPGGDMKTAAMRKGFGVQEAEVSNIEYVKNKIAQCMSDDTEGRKIPQGHGHPGGQMGISQGAEAQAAMGRGPHGQMMPQPTHSSTKQRTQSPVSSQHGGMAKENSHKHGRPDPRPSSGPQGPVSTSVDSGLQPRQQDLAAVSPSSSSQPSPDQHHAQDEESPRGSGGYQKSQQAQSPVSSVGDGREQVHSSQHPHRKGRMFSRPRSRMEQEETEKKVTAAPQRDSAKQAQRASPSASMQDAGRATSSDKKGPRSEYDFPDSPDDEALGKPLSSYMALSSTTRSPRRGVVDSSENRSQSGGDGNRDGESNVESSEDVSHSDSKVSDSMAGKDNEAQGYERFSGDQMEGMKMSEQMRKGDESQVSSRLGTGSSARKHSLEADDGSNISHASADSTDRLMVDESASIDSSSGMEVTSVSQSRRSSKSSRESDSSPHCGSEIGGSAEHVSHSRQAHRSRSPRTYPQSSSDHPSSMPTGSSMGFSRRGPEPEGSVENRDQEPQPLLSSQYETLSDDEQS